MTSKSWREILPVHPAAELFPLMSETELRELGEDIKKTGILTDTVTLWAESSGDGKHGPVQLLDGRNRLDALELVGVQIEIVERGSNCRALHTGLDKDKNRPISEVVVGIDPYAFVISANARRRHLTAEQKRELIAKVLKAQPAKSDRQIAKATKTKPDHGGQGARQAGEAGRRVQIGYENRHQGAQAAGEEAKDC